MWPPNESRDQKIDFLIFKLEQKLDHYSDLKFHESSKSASVCSILIDPKIAFCN